MNSINHIIATLPKRDLIRIGLLRGLRDDAINKTKFVLGTQGDSHGETPCPIVVFIQRLGYKNHARVVIVMNEKSVGNIRLVSILGRSFNFFVVSHDRELTKTKGF
ncbi:unnamed protein product [Prunus brigantina]